MEGLQVRIAHTQKDRKHAAKRKGTALKMKMTPLSALAPSSLRHDRYHNGLQSKSICPSLKFSCSHFSPSGCPDRPPATRSASQGKTCRACPLSTGPRHLAAKVDKRGQVIQMSLVILKGSCTFCCCWLHVSHVLHVLIFLLNCWILTEMS